MFTNDPRDALAVAHDHIRRLREEPAAERLRPALTLRHAVAAHLRRAADRLVRPPLAAGPA